MFFVSLAVLGAAFWILSYEMRRDIGMQCDRLRELEGHINGLAGRQLLEWESRWGSRITGSIWRKRPKKLTPSSN